MRRLVVLCGSIVVVDTMFFAALTPLLPEYADRFDLSKSGAGLLQAAYPLGVLVGGIPSGLAASRLGVKPTAVGALLTIAVTSTAFGFANSILLLDLARFAQGVASACAWTAAFAWLIALAPGERRGELIGTVLGVAIAGALFGPVLGGLAAVFGTEPVFAAVGVLALVVTVFAVLTDAPPPRAGQSIRQLWEALFERMVVVGLWLVALPALLFGTLTTLAPLQMSDLGLGAVTIGVVFLLAAIAEALLAPVMGRASDRRGRRWPITIALAGSSIATLLLPWPQRGALLAVLVLASAAVFGIFWAPAMSLLTDSAERVGLDIAWGFALANLAWAPGQAAGAALGGTLARLTSDALPYLLLSSCCLATLWAVRRA